MPFSGMRTSKGAGGAFFERTALWTVVLLLCPATLQLLSGPAFAPSWSLQQVVFLAVGWIGLCLPFSAFAGGLGSFGRSGYLRLGISALLVSVVSLVLLGFLSPVLEVQVVRSVGGDIERRFPMGPETIPTLLDLREEVRRNPPDRYSFRVGEPTRSPPNWLTYRAHCLIAMSFFGFLAALLGVSVAGFTSGLSPPARRNARWAMGLVSGVPFFLAEVEAGKWVRADLNNSGLLGAWGPLLLPLVELALLYLLLQWRRRRSTLSQPSSSDD
jgi:hypothetical protein